MQASAACSSRQQHCAPAAARPPQRPLLRHVPRYVARRRFISAPPAAASAAATVAAGPAAGMGLTWGGALAAGGAAAVVAAAGAYMFATRKLDESPDGAASAEERRARLEAIADGWIKSSFPEVIVSQAGRSSLATAACSLGYETLPLAGVSSKPSPPRSPR